MKNRLPLVVTLLALPLSVAVACGGDGGTEDESGGSGGSGGGSGGSADGGSGGSADGGSGGGSGGSTDGSGGVTSGGTSSGGSGSGAAPSGGSGGAMGGEAGAGAMAGMGGMGGAGLPSIADSCSSICDTVAPLDCADHNAGNCEYLCENDVYYFYNECAAEYQEMLDCWAALPASEWVCAGFWNGVYPEPGNCNDLEFAYGDCNDEVYCTNNPTDPDCQ